MMRRKHTADNHRAPLEGLEGLTIHRKTTVTVPFSQLTRPGAYYCHSTGWLYRIPDDMLSEDHSPLMNIVSKEDNLVTMISDDPWVPVGKARQICSHMDFIINF